MKTQHANAIENTGTFEMLSDKESKALNRVVRAAEIAQEYLNNAVEYGGTDGLTTIEMLDGMLAVLLANKQQIEGTPKVVSSVYVTLCMINEAAGHNGLAPIVRH